ncbi:hypothetical protein Y1Q_0017471 [Alligator mississippiensis]|uniref:Uncharacterized protein n=1 Tax=Alligator mississippiensis TaxID=8496 RepID=A0A151P226_ALLMI|nr:hypothetical protein Y1Q_0017471 [Alligator mississippiensis]
MAGWGCFVPTSSGSQLASQQPVDGALARPDYDPDLNLVTQMQTQTQGNTEGGNSSSDTLIDPRILDNLASISGNLFLHEITTNKSCSHPSLEKMSGREENLGMKQYNQRS